MKTILITIIFFISVSVFSQSISNTLGTNGVFSIKDASSDFFTLSQSTGEVNILKSLRLENTTSSGIGVIFKEDVSFLHNYGTTNIFLGIYSGNFTMTGSNNIGVGYQSLYSNTVGHSNIGVGYQSLYSNNTGYNNSAIGNNSLKSNTTGFQNTAIGNSALNSNITGRENTAIGFNSLKFNNSGNQNTSLGTSSLYANTTGSYNISVGAYSLQNSTTGDQNTAVGYLSLFSNTTGSINTALGDNSLYSNYSGNSNTAIGVYSLYSNTTGDVNTALGFRAGYDISTGVNVTCIGYDAQPSSSTASSEITLGNGDIEYLRCNVQTISSLSDARDKKNIKDLSLGLDFIMKVKPRQFNWDKREWYDGNKSDGSRMKETPTAGFIAQELDEAQTKENADWLNLVLKDNPEKIEATYGNLLPVMVKAIQELKTENDKLKMANESLATEVESLKQINEKIIKLEKMVNEMNSVKLTSLDNKKEINLAKNK